MRKLAIYGLSGAGKSTTCQVVLDLCRVRRLSTRVVKLAAPLYALQSEVHTLVGRPVEAGQQDQLLLRSLAEHLRRLNPTFLVENFLARVEAARQAGTEVVITDDLKDTTLDYPRLRANGFSFCHITCPDTVRERRLGARADLSQAPETVTTWRFDRIEPDWTIDNATDDPYRHQLRADVAALLDRWQT